MGVTVKRGKVKVVKLSGHQDIDTREISRKVSQAYQQSSEDIELL